MEYIEEEFNRINAEKVLFEDIFDIAVNELKDHIRETIKLRWLNGESVNGGKIINKNTGKGYSQLSYKALKLSLNPKAYGDVDLTMTGSLGDNINIRKTDSNDYEIISDDYKYLEIGNKYGFDEFGLNNDEMVFYIELLLESVENKIKNI